MVRSFQFSKVPQIHFGAGMIGRLPSMIKSFGNRILLVTGSESFDRSPESALLHDTLEKEGIERLKISIPGEPSPVMIDLAVRSLADEDIKLVAAIGGGSVIDAGKAISAMMYKDESVAEYLEGVGTRQHPGTRLPFIAVPTTSGTGSEATKNAVLSETGPDGYKRSLRHDNFVPDIAVLDPGLTISCPPGITAASGMDCFTQLTEAYLSPKASTYTDALAFEGLRALKSSLMGCFRDGSDISARAGMSFAALTSGICLANAGLGAVHGFASSVGGRYRVPHGVICGTLMAPANKVNVRVLRSQGAAHPALGKYAALGRLFSDAPGKNDDYCIDAFVEVLYEFTSCLKLEKLGKYGVDENEIELICSETDIKNNPVSLTGDDLREILAGRI